MFSQTAEYALRGVVWLAQHPDEGPTGVRRIARETQVPASYLAKVLQELARAGLLTSRRGVRGGFELSHAACDVTVLDVVNAVDPIPRITQCPLKLKTHKRRRCSMHARLDECAASVQEALARATIEDLLYEPYRPRPMIETT